MGENTDLSDTKISYVKLEPGDERFSYDVPTGNEGGAYEGEWVPGGFTKYGTREASLTGGDKIVHNNNVDNIDKIPGIKVESLKWKTFTKHP